MPIAVDIDVMLARRKMSVGELADRVGITPANLAVLKENCCAVKPRMSRTPRSSARPEFRQQQQQYRYGDSNPGFWHEKPAS